MSYADIRNEIVIILSFEHIVSNTFCTFLFAYNFWHLSMFFLYSDSISPAHFYNLKFNFLRKIIMKSNSKNIVL